MAPHIDGDRPKASSILVPVRTPNSQCRKSVRFSGMTGARVGDNSAENCGSLARAGFGETYAVPDSLKRRAPKTWRNSTGDFLLEDLNEISTSENVYAKVYSRNDSSTIQESLHAVGRKESVRTVIVNNLQDMGEIERILNDSSSDGYITSECERNLREKYGLHFEHSFVNYERHAKSCSLPPNVAVTEAFSYMNETMYDSSMTCGGGAMMRQKFADIVRRYTDFVNAAAFVRRVVSKAKNPNSKKRSRALKASKIQASPPGFETVIKPVLTVIPEACERTVGEALQLHEQQLQSREDQSKPRPEIALDLGNGDFERQRRVSDINGVVLREKSKKASEEIRSSARESGWSNFENKNSKKLRRSKLLSSEQKRCSGNGSNRNSYAGDRSSLMEEGASTSWLLVLYSPEFAPKTAKEKRYSFG
ncbi:hypothetical protein FHG87_006923, partial [Trinorchestia longiramus]